MAELLKAQQAGGDLEPHESSLRAAELPDPKCPLDTFPGHAAWIDGHWKLHRIADKQGMVTWELYDLATDAAETTNVAETKKPRVERMREELEAWLCSVTRSLNGEDYVAE